MLFNKGVKVIQWGKDRVFNKCATTAGYPSCGELRVTKSGLPFLAKVEVKN